MAPRSSNRTYSIGFGPGLTPAVKYLLIINTAVYILTSLMIPFGLGGLIDWLVLNPRDVIHHFYLWELVTYMFVHEPFPTIFHILFNMFALWMFGCDLESNWGSKRFLTYYFSTGIGAGLTAVLLSSSPVIGASGAIYGVLLAYGVLFPDRLIYMYFLIPIRAKWFVLIMGGIEFLSELTMPGSTVSHVAHLGGMLVGFLYLRGRPFYFDLRLMQKLEVVSAGIMA